MKVQVRRVIMGAVLAVLVAGSALASGPAAHAAGVTLRVGYFANITHAQAVLGFGEGIFASELRGVTVKGTVFNAGGDEVNAMFAGAIDIGYLGAGPAINAYVKSRGGVVIIAGSATGGELLVARAGSNIKTVKDLAGKTVSSPQVGNTQDIVLRALLKDNGLAPTESGGSVKILAVQNADTLSLFQKGGLDAALVPEPWGSRLIKEAGASLVLDNAQIYGGAVPTTVVAVTSAFLKAHPDVVVRFLRVHAQLTRSLADRGVGVRNTLNAQIKALTGKALADDELATALSRTAFGTRLYTAQLVRFAGFEVETGFLKKGTTIAGLVNTWPLDHLLDKTIK